MEVGAAGRFFEGDVVGDEGGCGALVELGGGVVRRAERVHVGVVRGRVLGDRGCLAVARRAQEPRCRDGRGDCRDGEDADRAFSWFGRHIGPFVCCFGQLQGRRPLSTVPTHAERLWITAC